jgi:hypothetical protein
MTPSQALARVVNLRQADGPSPGLPRFDPDHEALAETSTDALELAALLEAGGITDRRVQEDYGYENVFAYAREIFAETERRATVAVRPESDITFTPARSTARLAPILTVLFLQAILGDQLANLSRGELAAALVIPMLGSAIVLAPAGYLGSRYVVCGYMRPGAAAALRLLWVGTALLALTVIGGTVAASGMGMLGSSWGFATVGLVSAALWALVSLLLTLEKELHVHGAVIAALGVGLLVASFSGVTVGTAAGAVAFAACGTFAVAMAVLRSPPMSTRVPPLRRQIRSLFPAAFYGVLGPVIVLADWPAAHLLGVDRTGLLAFTTAATFAVVAAVLFYELSLARLQRNAEEVLAGTPVDSEGALRSWTGDALGTRRRRAVLGVSAFVAIVAGGAAALAGLSSSLSWNDAVFLAASVAGYAAVGVLHGELLVLVWLGRPGPAVGIQAVVAALAVTASFPLTAALGVWAGPVVFLAICPVGIALTRVVTSRALGEGAYSFYRAAF